MFVALALISACDMSTKVVVYWSIACERCSWPGAVAAVTSCRRRGEDVDHIVDDVLRFAISRTLSPPSYPSSSSSASDDSLPPAYRHSK